MKLKWRRRQGLPGSGGTKHLRLWLLLALLVGCQFVVGVGLALWASNPGPGLVYVGLACSALLLLKEL